MENLRMHIFAWIFVLYIIQMQSKKIEIKEYISSQVNVFVEPLVYTLVKERPANPVAFAISWLKEYAEKHRKQDDSDSQGEEEAVAELEAKLLKKKAQGKSRSRIAISEEVFGCFNKKEAVQLTEVPKDQETTLLIKSLIRNSILFQNIDSRDQEALIKAMNFRDYAAGERVITEGDRGDDLFIVESGQFDCSKLIDSEEKYLKTYSHGEAFGELALMYNSPRAASIVCKEPGKLYSLDRITFSQVVKQAAFKKRELYKNVIEKIEVFSSINSVEKQQFLDILKEERYEQGQYVIKQGEQGNKFYIILQGQLAAEKTETAYELPRVVYRYKEGEYFGELALLHDVCRQASVKALTSVRVAYLDRESFKRIFGSMEDILKRSEEKYSLASEEIICA